MARRELRRKITATVLTVTALCCLLGVCAWLLLGSNVFSDTIRIMMLVCTVVLGVATIGLLVAKVQEIRALREIIRSEDAQQQSEAETPRPELAPLQTLDHTTIELPPLPDIPAPAAQPAPKQAKQQPKTKQGRSKKRGRAMEQPAAETMAPAQPVLQPIEVVPPTPVAPPRPVQQTPQPEQPSVERKWKPIDFNAAMQQRLAEEAAARQRAIEAARRAEEARLAEEARRAEEARLAEEARRAEEARLAEEARRAEEARLAEEVHQAEEAQAASAQTGPVAEGPTEDAAPASVTAGQTDADAILSPGTSLRLRYPSPFRRNPRRGLWPRFLSLFPQSRNFSLPHKRFRKHRRSQRLCFRNRRRTLRPPAAQKRTPCACKPPAMHRKPAALPRAVPPKRLSLLLLRARLKKHVWLRRRSELRHPRLLSPHLRRYLLNALPSRRKPNSPVQTSG